MITSACFVLPCVMTAMVSLPTARFVQDIPRGGRALTRFFRTTNFLPGHVFPHKMSQLLTYFVRLVLFRSGPQDAPASEQYLIATGVLVAVSYALTNNLYDSVYHRVVIAVSQVIVFGAVVWVVLRLRNLQARWTQTLTALFGAAALFQFATWPVVELASSGEPSSMGLPQPLWFHIATGAWYWRSCPTFFVMPSTPPSPAASRPPCSAS
ncbi:MAG: hypothetical protein M5U09_21870 [Gammaproteobacteria bacterium]|nr:hypothetical protein [Gammaproteobacteria bacterium]